jgi:hypothetical protein
MIQLIVLFLLFIVGYLFTKIIFTKLNFIETLGYTIFFSILIVPLILINLNFLFGVKSSVWIIILISVILLGLEIIFIKFKNLKFKKLFDFNIREDRLILFFLFLVIVFSFFYYNNSVYYLSLTSFIERGESNCFYMLTFALQPDLSQNAVSVTPYDILSTPGNSMFTSFVHPILNFNSFRFMYVIFQGLLFLFMYLFIKYMTKKKWSSIIIALFAIFNPFSLFIEVLDRNFMVIVLSVILFYSVYKFKDKVWVHAIIFGVLLGTGLRFLPLIFLLPVSMIYFKQKISPKKYLLFLVVAFICFAYNIPHLKYHGLNSIGETQNYFGLVKTAFSSWIRTPFIPFPNLIYIIMQMLNYFGYIVSTIVLFGIYDSFRRRKHEFLVFSLVFMLPLLSLSIQRDFLETPKLRIIIMSFVSVFLFLGYGLDYIVKMWNKNKLSIAIRFGFILLFIFMMVTMFSTAFFEIDQRFYDRKFLYQSESQSYYEFIRKQSSYVQMIPGYNNLGNKLDLVRKSKEQEAVLYNVYNRPMISEYLFSQGVSKPILPVRSNIEFVNVKINFEDIVMNQDKAVFISNEDSDVFIDFSEEDNLFDVYYNEFDVSWQSKMLPLVVFPKFSDTLFLDEIYLDLNSFISYGEDELGFDRINSINYMFYPQAKKFAYETGMLGFPTTTTTNEIILRVPTTTTIIIRNWFINGANSQPFRIDSWVIDSDELNSNVEFQLNEPENYI